MSKRRLQDMTAEELEIEASSRLAAVGRTPDLRARQIVLMEFERLRALASMKRRECTDAPPAQDTA
jgi:hypothetical protein